MTNKEPRLSVPTTQHLIQLCAMLIAVGTAWGIMSSKVDALEADEKATIKKVEVLTSDLNKQAITIGQIVVTTKNIEKQMEKQERILERISVQLMSPRPNN